MILDPHGLARAAGLDDRKADSRVVAESPR